MSNFSYYENDLQQHRAWKQIIIQEHETELTCTGACHENSCKEKKKKVISAWVQSKKKGLFCALNDLEKPLFTHVAH